MEINGTPPHGSGFRNPVSSFFLVLLISFMVFAFIGPFLGILVVLPFFDYDAFKLLEQLSPPFTDTGIRAPLFIIQGVTSALAFILFPLLYIKYGLKQDWKTVFTTRNLTAAVLAMSAVFILLFMVVNSVIIEWNREWPLPQFFMDLEAQAEELTAFLTEFAGIGELILAIVVIAIIPAIGEELVFRGLLQRMAQQFSKNHHIAVWLCAIIFSAFHLQFLGFVPRMLLGAIFGYLYVWSGSLWLPMFAHFVNNAFTIVMVYLYQTSQIEFDIEGSSSAPLGTALLFAALCGILLFLIRKNSNFNKDEEVAEGI